MDANGPPTLPTDARPAAVYEPAAAPAALEALRRGAWSCGRWLKRDGERWVYAGRLLFDDGGGAHVVLKSAPARGGIKGLVRRLAPGPGGEFARQARGAALLASAGLLAAPPILAARSHRTAWLLLRHVEGEDLLRLCARGEPSTSQQHAAADALGAALRKMRGAGLWRRDCKLSNVVRTPDGNLVFVDTGDVSRRRGAVERMLTPALKEAAGAGTLPRRALRMRCLHAACGDRAHAAWRRLAAELEAAGDTTPRIDPLG